MRIALVTEYNPDDRFARSGVVNSIYMQLRKFADVVWIDPAPNSGYRLCLFKALLKIIYWLHKCNYKVTRHLPLITNLYAREIKLKLPKDVDGLFFFDSYHFAKLKIDIPIFFRNDSVFHQMVGYYYFNIPHLFVKLSDKIEYEAMNRMSIMFSPSNWVRKCIEEHYSGNQKKVIVIESGANLYRTPVYTPKNIDLSQVNLLFIGYQSRRKRVELAAECCRLLNEQYHINSKLTIIGKDVPKEIIDAYYVNYMGPIDKNKDEGYQLYEEVLSRAHILVFPTKAECAGIVVCEASAYGIPTVSCDTGGIANYVIDGENGILLNVTDTADKYAQIIFDMITSKKYQIYSQKARFFYETKFNWDIWGNKVCKIMENIIC